MKKTIFLLTILIGFFSTSLFAQSSFGVGDLDSYFTEYFKPLTLGMATGMGTGWAHEVQPHKTLGFDISLSVVAVMVSESDLTFSQSALSDMSDNGYTFVDKNGNPVADDYRFPTVLSNDETNAYLQKDISPDASIELPIKVPALDGLSPYPYAPNFSLQLAVGLPKGTEIIGRFVPNIGSMINDAVDIDEVTVNKLNLWGIGVKHDIKQWIPIISKIPILEISALVAYSEFNFDITSTDPIIGPDELLPEWVTANYEGMVDLSSFENQGYDISMSAFVGSIMVGANIPVIHPYVAMGFNRASVNTGLTGNFPRIEFKDATDVDVVIDPDNLYLEEERTFMNFQAGINVKIPIVTLHAQYCYQQYSMLSAGISFGFR